MGHPRRAGRAAREVLPLLPRALHRHLLQHHAAAQDPLLHGQPHNPLREHLLPLGPRVLPARRLRREDRPLHQHPPLADHVLPPDLRDHPLDVPGAAAARQVPPIHDGAGGPLGRHHHHHPERALPQAQHPQDGPLGAERLHPAAAQDPADARARRPARRPGRPQDLRAQRQGRRPAGQALEQVQRGGRGGRAAVLLAALLARVHPARPAAAARLQRPPPHDLGPQPLRRRQHRQQHGQLQRAAHRHVRPRRVHERRRRAQEVPLRAREGPAQRHVHPAPHTAPRRV